MGDNSDDIVFRVPLTTLGDGRVRSFEFMERGRFGFGFVFAIGDDVRAYRNRCPHWDTPLDQSDGEFFDDEGDELRCGTHDARFDPRSGLCTAGPCEGQSLEALTAWVDDAGVVCVRRPAGVSLGIGLSLRTFTSGSDD